MIRQFSLFFCALVSIGIIQVACCQVNIEKVRPSLQKGFNATIQFSYAARTGNQKRIDLGGGGRAGYRFENRELFVIGNIGYGRSNDQTYANRSFAHLRFVEESYPSLAFELFGQVENDEFTQLSLRMLAGGGIRLQILRTDAIEWIQGSGPMIVHENLKPTSLVIHPAQQTLVRWNNYTILRYTFGERVAFLATFYFQPALATFYDSRVLFDSTLNISLSESITFITHLNLRYDSRPPDNIGSSDFEITNAIQISLP